MSACCAACSNTMPCGCVDVSVAGPFCDPTTMDQACTLGASLIAVVDQARNQYACLGLRAYTVHVVKTRWSGGERGMGVEQVISEIQILPVPKVTGLDALDRVNKATGLVEQGTVRIEEISARYSEDELLGSTAGRQIPADQQFFWEVRALDLSGKPTQRRRLYPAAPPQLDRINPQWKMRFTRQHGDRGRAGDPR